MSKEAPSEENVDLKAKALGDELAFPCLPPVDPSGGGSAGGYPYPEMGMRKRELFAAQIMASLCTTHSGGSVDHDRGFLEYVAQGAVMAADALLKALAE